MIVANFTTVKPEMAHSRTYEDFSKFLGERPERLGIVSRMLPFEKMTASYLTEAVGNVMTNDNRKPNKYQSIDAFSFDWEIEQNFIKYVPFAATVTEDGQYGAEITMIFPEKYYELDDTFIIEDSKQMCIVVEAPRRAADNYFEYKVKLMSGDFKAKLDTSACYEGARTRWIGNVKQEYHDSGCVKFTSNVEKCRGYINEIRCDIDASARYEAFEEAFIKLSRGSDANGWEHKIFRWPEKKKLLLNNFMAARNQALLWQHTTMDVNGKPTITDRLGRPIIAGDGIIPQINRYCSKFNYVKLTASLLNEVILNVAQKCDSIMGNNFAFVVNEHLWYNLQDTLSEFLQNHKTDGGYVWSKSANGMVKVGASYDSYTFAGNTVIFHVDRALSIEYPNGGYGIMVDLTGDKESGRPAIEMFTVRNRQIIENTITGTAIRNGEAATPVSGIKYVISGYSGVAVYSPYRSAVLFLN